MKYKYSHPLLSSPSTPLHTVDREDITAAHFMAAKIHRKLCDYHHGKR
jgi:hypothetical protein